MFFSKLCTTFCLSMRSLYRWHLNVTSHLSLDPCNGFNEIKYDFVDDTYSYSNYEKVILYMNVISFALMKLLD